VNARTRDRRRRHRHMKLIQPYRGRGRSKPEMHVDLKEALASLCSPTATFGYTQSPTEFSVSFEPVGGRR
jgi:hypothetical protein